MSVSGFFDESGKFKDHQVVSFGGVAAQSETFNQEFGNEWRYLLDNSGLEVLSAKTVFHHKRPLSDRLPALGIDDRIRALLPFICCVRKHLQLALGAALDVTAFKQLPSHYFQILGDDPFFTAFLSMVLAVVRDVPAGDHLSFICDDEEEMALPMYKLYRRVKIVSPEAREKMLGISFADDRFLFGLQAADLLSSLMRYEGGKKFFDTDYEYAPLFAALAEPPRPHEEIRRLGIAFCDKTKLMRFAEHLKQNKA